MDMVNFFSCISFIPAFVKNHTNFDENTFYHMFKRIHNVDLVRSSIAFLFKSRHELSKKIPHTGDKASLDRCG